MENEGKKSKSWFAGLIIATVLIIGLIGAGIATYPNWSKEVSNMFSDKEQIAQISVDTIVTPTITIEDVITMREVERKYRYLDSVYMNMPEVSLIAILIKEGVDMSHTDIAQEYLQNRKMYNDVQFGAQINDLYKHSINLEPDTIPKQAKADVPIVNKE